MNILICGLGAAGCKVVNDAIKAKVINENDTIMINSTSKDFPKDYKGKTIIISPQNVGCGKEREVSKAYIINAIKNNMFDLDYINKYSTIILVSSTEGGTGSGATPTLAQYFAKVLVKNVHIFCLSSFGML